MTQNEWHHKQFAKGEFIIKEGTWGDRVFEIESGEVVIFKHGVNGQVIPLATAGPGDLFGEMYLLNKEHLRNASAVATTELLVRVYFEELIIQDMVGLNPRQRKMVEGLTKKLVNTTDSYVTHKSILSPEHQPKGDQDEESAKKAVEKLLPKVKPSVHLEDDRLSTRE